MASRAEWAKRVAAWERSGRSRTAFAKQEGLNPQTLAWWRWKFGSAEKPRRSRRQRRREPTVSFVELAPGAVLETGSVRERIELELAEVRIRVLEHFESSVLARVLDVVRGR